MEKPKSEKDFIVEIKGKAYKIDILKLIFVSIFTALPIAGIVYMMFKFPWLSHTLLAISYTALSIFAFAKNVSVLDDCATALRYRHARDEHYDFSKEENDAILKVMASISINIIVSLSLMISVVSSKTATWILYFFIIFSLSFVFITLVIVLRDGYYRILVPWIKGEFFKNIKDGN